MREACAQGIPHAIGGGLAVQSYTVHRQVTKDLDVYVVPQDRQRMIQVVSNCGLGDLFDRQPYDRNWIYRSYRDDTIVDVIWAMPNQRAQVDSEWLSRGPLLDVGAGPFRVLPAEELIWAKLYVLQRDRCDWPDVLNLIYATAPNLDWAHLLSRVGDDAPLLHAVLTVFRWLCPQRAAKLPSPMWRSIAASARKHRNGTKRANLLDTRPWFIPALEHTHQEN